VEFAKAEGIVPAPETIRFNLSGQGNFDMQACTDYLEASRMTKRTPGTS
jgi:predicted alternative tryptophan synthase beta-subunit